ncbi:MAG: SprT family zinc-dependent metalloprotease [Bacteroidia bacterium]|nr:SprT family zinc-dependent metalloprotease [Bacteroidia bacterium]
MTSAIQFGSKQIDFHLEYSDRKSLGITVKPDLSVLVKAPVDTSLEKVLEKLRKKAPWIIRQQSFFLYFYPKTPARKFISGETHLYLGRQYRLKVNSEKLKVRSERLKIKNEEVKLRGKFLEICTHDSSKVKELVETWYLTKAKDKFQMMAKPMFEEFVKTHNLSLFTFHLSLRNMSTRWGSCTPKGKIILNPELIKAPKGCIEYVIIHELCHLVHHDHTQKFIDLQTKEMKDWEKWKMKLEKLLA